MFVPQEGTYTVPPYDYTTYFVPVVYENDYPTIGAHYRHYKGGLYKVLFLSKHTETGEVLVNYQSLHFGSYHTRPLEIWNSAPDQKESTVRFTLERLPS